jgi:hypothetical protein
MGYSVILQALTDGDYDNAYDALHAYVSGIQYMTGNMLIVTTKRLNKVQAIDGYKVLGVPAT